MVYCVDFDGTLCIDGKPNYLLFSQMRALQAQGNAVVLFTSRTGNRVSEAVAFCRKYGLLFNNVIGGKPIADFYIDDKAINPFGGGMHG
jgi:hypothetical protein